MKRPLGNSGIMVEPLCFGGNVFGWTAGERMSFSLLDAFVDEGFNFIDTADVYSSWAPGHTGGESETLIGRWLKRSGKRSRVVIATKVGMEMGGEGAVSGKGLSRRWILNAVEGSLRRLGVDCIDLYQSHKDDPSVPMEETMAAFDQLVRDGKVRAVGASQFSAGRLREALEVSRRAGLVGYCCLQPLYNLYDRASFESELLSVVREYDLAVINYYSLAAGFLSGKYRAEADLSRSPRGEMRVRSRYFNDRGFRILAALDQVAQRVGVSHTTIAIAWLLTKSFITAPIASATNLDQLSQLIAGTRLKLDEESLQILERASFN